MQHKKQHQVLAIIVFCVTLVGAVLAFDLASALAQMVVAQEGPVLRIAGGLAVQEEGMVTVPLSYQANGHEVVALVFSIDFDERCLALDLTDADGDGMPDTSSLHVPPNMSASIMVDVTDTDGEIDVLIADIFPPFTILPDTAQLGEFTFQAICKPTPGGQLAATVAFSNEPPPSFSDTKAKLIQGTASSNAVAILSKIPPTPTATGTRTPLPTSTLPSTPTPTSTPTLIPTAFVSPTATPRLSPTATATLIPTAAPQTLVSRFTADVEIDGVMVQWETSQEVYTRAFQVYRLTLGQRASFVPLRGERLSQGAQGGTYSYFDNTADPAHPYSYLLVEEKQNGKRIAYYSQVATVRFVTIPQPQPQNRILLPLIMR